MRVCVFVCSFTHSRLLKPSDVIRSRTAAPAKWSAPTIDMSVLCVNASRASLGCYPIMTRGLLSHLCSCVQLCSTNSKHRVRIAIRCSLRVGLAGSWRHGSATQHSEKKNIQTSLNITERFYVAAIECACGCVCVLCVRT